MPGPAPTPPKSASSSIWDTILRLAPQTGGIMKASDALGMAAGNASKDDLTAQLAAMKAKGPPDGHYSKAWEDQVNALARAAQDAKR